jgi:threonine dehydrogenase-like Zn-dependent dehydrogenase
MKAIALVPGTTNLRLVDRPEPAISSPDQVKLQVLQVGVCGTDRAEAQGGRAEAPPGRDELIIGHEMIGRVVETGAAVTRVGPGDYAVFSVRRGCGRCSFCNAGRSDMCYTGEYAERGIKKQDGYQTEYVVDSEEYVVKVPREIASIGVLTEPTSVAEKAIDEATLIQRARLPDATDTWLAGKRVVVAGLGPVGLLAAFALRLRDAEVLGLDIVDHDSRRVEVLETIGGHYVDGRKVRPETLREHFGEIDLIFEATGVAHLEFDLLSALGLNGLYVLTGIPEGDRPIDIHGAVLMRNLVLRNQVVVGSVNASKRHFEMAVEDLARARDTWGDAIDRVITHRLPYSQFADALLSHPEGEIKAVLEWAQV